jgi:hypothetical protein
MATSPTPTTPRHRLAAHLPRPSGLVTGFASGHPPKGSVALPLFPFVGHRPASTIQNRVAAWGAAPTI